MSEGQGDKGDNKAKGQRFRKERRKQARRNIAIQRDTAAEIARLLKEADEKIRAELAGQPSDYKQWYLPRVQQSIRQTLEESGTAATGAVTGGADKAWQAGVDLIDKPLEAAGVTLIGRLSAIDRDQLVAMKGFMTNRMQDVNSTMVNRVNSQLGLVVIGAQAPSDAVREISRNIEGGRDRAITIVRTEVGGAYATASQARLEQASEAVPGLMKQWRRSGKRNSRHSHDLAHGQVRPVDEPFMVGGDEIMFPRDPKAKAKHRINCGCTHLPYMPDWEVKHPREQPFSAEERSANMAKKLVSDVRSADYQDWVSNTLDRRRHATGEIRTVAQLPAGVTAKLAPRGIAPLGSDIMIGDRQLVHMRRDLHVKKADALPVALLRDLPDAMTKPKAILLDRTTKAPTLVYVLPVRGEKRLARVVVKLGDEEKRNKHKRGNIVVSGSLVSKATLGDAKSYELLAGHL